MEYAGSYALFNYSMEDAKLGMEYSNLRLVRAFEHGLDPSSSEAGFVLVHVDMVKHSGRLVEGSVDALAACGEGDRKAFNAGLELVVEAMVDVNGVMDGEMSSFSHRPEQRKVVQIVESYAKEMTRHVEQIQTKRLQQLPHFHFRHHQAIHVSPRRRLRRCQRRTNVFPRRKRCE